MTYNVTSIIDATSFYAIVKSADDYSGNILTGLMILAVFFVLLFSLKKYEFDVSLLVSSWICSILSMFLVYAKLLNFLFLIGFVAMTAFMTFYFYVVRSDE